jgi:hypothetical protein
VAHAAVCAILKKVIVGPRFARRKLTLLARVSWTQIFGQSTVAIFGRHHVPPMLIALIRMGSAYGEMAQTVVKSCHFVPLFGPHLQAGDRRKGWHPVAIDGSHC